MRVYVDSVGRPRGTDHGHDLERKLHERGHSIAATTAGAEVAVVVTCAGGRPNPARTARRCRQLAEQLPHVFVSGCPPPSGSSGAGGPGPERAAFIPAEDGYRLSDAIERAVVGADPIASAATVEILLSTACRDACTYCGGPRGSRPAESVRLSEVVRRVERARDRGAADLRLAARDTAAWGNDLASRPSLPDLLRAVTDLPGAFRARLGPMSARSVSPVAQEYFGALATAKAFQFVDLPLGSGSDAVLAALGRTHTTAQYTGAVRAARQAMPDVQLATEVVVGHPEESEDAFRASLEVLTEASPDLVRAHAFASAAPTRVARRRARDVTELATRIARDRRQRWVGWEGSVVITGHGPDASCIGRLPNYLPLRLPETLTLGAVAPVRVDAADGPELVGHRTGPAESAVPWVG